MKLSSQQNDALKAVRNWFLEFYTSKRTPRWFYLAGYAGTGKTTLARHFADNADGEVVYGAYTGKAANVLRQNGCYNAKTIHSLIYKAIEHDDGTVTFEKNYESPLKDAVLVIIDECSMVNEEIGKDLLSFGKPILVLGDPGQLPPIEGFGFFTNKDPDFMLTEIHRQAKDNPIIYLATKVRNGGVLSLGKYGESEIISRSDTSIALEMDQLLVGRNQTRTNLNSRMRKLLGFEDAIPMKNDKLICLKNDSTLQIFNGGLFTVAYKHKKPSVSNFLKYTLNRDDSDGHAVLARIHASFFNVEVPTPDWRILKGSQEFDYAYAITVHKAQGSQWDKVIIYDESYCFRDDRNRWLYTAITRAKEKMVMVKT